MRPYWERAATLALWGVMTAAATTAAVDSRTPIEWVDPLIGTGGHLYGVGGDPPGAQVPFGLVKFSPDTTPVVDSLWLDFEHYGGANYEDHYINAFSVLHMVGPGALDLGTLGVMPISEPQQVVKLNGAKARYSHASERARPGHYTVVLTDGPAGSSSRLPVQVELTATSHVALMRITPSAHTAASVEPQTLALKIDPRHVLNANEAKHCTVVVDVKAGTISGHLIDNGGLSGRSPSTVTGQKGLDLWFHATFPSQTLQPNCTGAVQGDEVLTASSQPKGPISVGGNISAFACVDAASGSMVMKMGVSTVSAAHAVANVAEECPDASFDQVVSRAEAEWSARMATYELVDAPDEEPLPSHLLTSWWTAVYHTLMGVSTYSEADGVYISFDGGTDSGFGQQLRLDLESFPNDRQLSDMSIWDTHRSWNPLMVLLQPDIATAVARSLVRMTQEGGSVPRWPLAHGYTGCMIGNHAGQVVLDTWRKGLRDFDVEVLWAGLLSQARFTNNSAINRADLSNYLKHGHCVLDKGEPAADYAASCTLAYAFDDWALAELSQELGKDDAIVSEFTRRSKSYANVWDNSSRYFCPRSSDGAFLCPASFAPESWAARAEFGGDKINGYVEGDAAQWRWFVPHDVDGLIELFGGNASFTKELEAFFQQSTDPRWTGTDVPNPYYWPGNEPGLLAPWLGSLSGRPDLTASFTRWVLDTYFTPTPNGLPGNDDFATMSAWAVWGWLGFYPLTGTDLYMLGAPRFHISASGPLAQTPAGSTLPSLFEHMVPVQQPRS